MTDETDSIPFKNIFFLETNQLESHKTKNNLQLIFKRNSTFLSSEQLDFIKIISAKIKLYFPLKTEIFEVVPKLK